MRSSVIAAAIVAAAFLGCASTHAKIAVSEKDGMVTLENDYLKLTVDPKQGDHIQKLRATKLDAPDPFDGVVFSGPMFVETLTVDGKVATPAPATAKVEKSANAASAEFTSSQGNLQITRRYTLASDKAAVDDEMTIKNNGAAVMNVAFGTRSQLTSPQTWVLIGRSTRYYFKQGDGAYETFSVSGYDGILQDGKVHEQKIEYATSPACFALVNTRGAGLNIAVNAGGPMTVTQAHSGGGSPANYQGAFSCEGKPISLMPGQAAKISNHVMLLDGQGKIEADSGDGIVAWLDVPPYRDPDDRVEISSFVGSDRDREITATVKIRNGGAAPQVHAEKTVACKIGKTVETMMDLEKPPVGTLNVELVLSEKGKDLCRIAKTVYVGEGAAEAKPLSAEYHKTFPIGENFEGTLAEYGKHIAKQYATPDAVKKMKALEADLSSDPAKSAHAEKMLALYQKWFPNYVKMLAGSAELYGVSVRTIVFSKQPMTKNEPATGGCLDMVFNGANQNFLCYNKERGGTSTAGIVYSRFKFTDGLSLHWGHAANSAGLCSAGADINASEQDKKKAEAMAKDILAKKYSAPEGLWLIMLECKTVDDAQQLLEQSPFAFTGAGNYMIADAKSALHWQSYGYRMLVRRAPLTDWKTFTCTNYPRGDWEAGGTGNGVGMQLNGQLREGHLAKLAQDLPANLSPEIITRVLRNHGAPGPLCQHGNDNPALFSTVMSYYVDPMKGGDLFITYANPCMHKYNRYSIR